MGWDSHPWWRGRHVGGLGADTPGVEHRRHAQQAPPGGPLSNAPYPPAGSTPAAASKGDEDRRSRASSSCPRAPRRRMSRRRARPMKSASCACCSASRRVAQHRLRHVVDGADGHRRLLPVAAAGAPALVGAPSPDAALGRRRLAAVAQREGAGAARAARRDPRRGPGSSVAQLVPYETTDRERDLALALASRCTAPTRGTVIWAPRAAAVSCSRGSARRIRSASSGSPARATRSPRSPSSAPGGRTSRSSS